MGDEYVELMLLGEWQSSFGELFGMVTDSLSKPIGELLLAAESVLADREWLIMARGGGELDEEEGVGDTDSLCCMCAVVVDAEGSIKARSPFGNLVGTSWTPAFDPALRKMPF